MAPSPRRRRLHAAGAATSALLADTYLSLTARPLRTSAMVAGIVLGVASATAAVVVADTQRAQIDRRFDAQRSHFVVLLANGDTSHAFPSRRVSEIEALEPVAAAGELSIWDDGVAVSTSPLARTARVPLIGATASGLAAAEVRTVSGIPVRAIDRLPGRSVVWVGVALARRLGIRMDLPQTASIAARPYTVAGLVRDDAGFGYVNDAVVMASALARVRYGPGKTVRFLAHVRPGSAGARPGGARAAAPPPRPPPPAGGAPRPSGRGTAGPEVAAPAARRRLRLSRRRGSTAARGGASDNDRRLHPHRAMVVDRAVELVRPLLRERDLELAARARRDRPGLLLDAVALDLERVVDLAGVRGVEAHAAGA